MFFNETKLRGAFVIGLDRKVDQRGFFARTFCVQEFEAHGLNPRVVQCNLSYNRQRGTLRGMHWQAPPSTEAKLVRATRGAVLDVIVDLRPESATYLQHVAIELSADNRRMLYIPEGFAHAYCALTDECEVFYKTTGYYSPEHDRGFRWNDPEVKIQWPVTVPMLSAKDAQAPYLNAADNNFE